MLNAERIEVIFRDCLFKEGEDTTTAILAKGIVIDAGFHPVRLENYRNEVSDLLFELPVEFQKAEGGGWSFLNACVDRKGRHWGEHRNMEQLFLLGLALGKVKCQMPREMWSMLPGGVPYYVVL
jgi:hypothetical protein